MLLPCSVSLQHIFSSFIEAWPSSHGFTKLLWPPHNQNGGSRYQRWVHFREQQESRMNKFLWSLVLVQLYHCKVEVQLHDLCTVTSWSHSQKVWKSVILFFVVPPYRIRSGSFVSATITDGNKASWCLEGYMMEKMFRKALKTTTQTSRYVVKVLPPDGKKWSKKLCTFMSGCIYH